jgi:hypothetical protein
MRKIHGVALSHAPEASNTNAKRSIHCHDLLRTSNSKHIHRQGRKGREGKARARKLSRVKAVHWLMIRRSESWRYRSTNNYSALNPQLFFLRVLGVLCGERFWSLETVRA